MSDVDVLLATAEQLLDEVVPSVRGIWPRTVAVVTRAALELSLDGFWRRTQAEVVGAPARTQLLLLASYAGPEVSSAAAEAWSGLSRASHHHAYELAPTARELRDWLNGVREVRTALEAS